MITLNSKGVAIRISDSEHYGMEAKQIINQHYRFCVKNNSPVYFQPIINRMYDLKIV